MTSNQPDRTSQSSDGATSRNASGETDIRELGYELWSYRTGKGATVEYAFDNLSIEVPS